MTSPSREMTLAIEKGNVERCVHLYHSHPDIQNKVSLPGTWLHYAADCAQPEIVQEFISFGMNVNQIAGAFKQTPLACAAKRGDCEIARMLLAAGARVETDPAPDRSLLAGQDFPLGFLGNFEPTPDDRVNPELEFGSAISGGHLDFLKILLEAAEPEMQLEDLKAFKECAYKYATTNQKEIVDLFQDAIARTSLRMLKAKPKEVDIVRLSDDGEVIPLGTSSEVAARLTDSIPDLKWHTEPGLMTQIEQNQNHPLRGLSERWDDETKARFSQPSRQATLEHPDFSLQIYGFEEVPLHKLHVEVRGDVDPTNLLFHLCRENDWQLAE